MASTCPCPGLDIDETTLQLQFDPMLEEYAAIPGSLIPILQIAQSLFGYLPEAVLKRIAEKLDKSYSEVAGVVGFYSFFSTKPRGKNLIRVCLGTSCYVRGGREILDSLKKILSIDIGQTTADRQFSLGVGRCFGACGLSPVIMVNDDVHQRVKPSKLAAILNIYRTPPGNGKEHD